MISARTKAALAAAKRRGMKLGGDRGGIIASQSPKGVKASMKVRREKARKRAADLLPEIEAIQAEGTTSFSQIAAALNQRGIPAPRGGDWQAVQVQRVLKLV
jgi:DNA invertase Pin-like site-specific DNA recombinase